MNINKVEVSHLTDWSWPEFLLHLVGAMLIPIGVALLFLILFGVGLWILETTKMPTFVDITFGLVGLIALCGSAALGLVWFGQVFHNVLRHTTSLPRALGLTVLVLVALVFAANVALEAADLSERWHLAAAAAAVGIPLVGALVGDALHRASASTGMSVALFLFVLTGLVIWLGIMAMKVAAKRARSRGFYY